MGEKNPKITDLLGVRIICPFIEDLDAAEKLISKNFEHCPIVFKQSSDKGGDCRVGSVILAAPL
jgi:ppGpp synthetase/RelA/SpoT-type nucleotidyltranferase